MDFCRVAIALSGDRNPSRWPHQSALLGMASSADISVARPRTWRWYAGFTLVALIIVAMLVGAWMLYAGITVSIQAEINLHATLFTIRLVEQFAHENGRWPKSWSELEQLPFPSDAPSPLNGELTVLRIGGSRGSDWPTGSPHLRECVTIDFGADANTIINQDPMEFEAIKPNGPCYPYRHYGFVDSLQETLKKTTADGRPTPHAR